MDRLAYEWVIKRIAHHISEPKTWVNFQLLCKHFYNLTKHMTEDKKLQSRISIRDWLKRFTNRGPQYIHIYLPCEFDIPIILPNGNLHGIVKSGSHGSVAEHLININNVRDGKLVSVEGIQGKFNYSRPNPTLRFVEHICVIHGPKKITLCDLSKDNVV